jgi:hypothetical protein
MYKEEVNTTSKFKIISLKPAAFNSFYVSQTLISWQYKISKGHNLFPY